VRAAARVVDVYDGDAASIWAPGTPASVVDQRLREFYRIGQKKAAMAVELLVGRMGAELSGLSETEMAYDVHVRRVFLRAGLIQHDSVREVVEAGRRLNPERPGFLDLPTWFVGRQWCHPTAPDCVSCPLSASCRRHTHLNVS
jgi:endonuclease III